jgi:hypothetical protein
MEYTVFYRPGEEPKQGFCPGCDIDMDRSAGSFLSFTFPIKNFIEQVAVRRRS